jgi:N,N'-diacetylchitobiose phosphorylase
MRAMSYAVPARLLGNERYGVLVTGTGAGFSAFEGLALSRWLPDPLLEPHGPAMYLRDLESGAFWSICGTAAGPASGGVHEEAGSMRVDTVHEGIRAHVGIGVARSNPCEVRLIRVQNGSDRPRRLQLTTYAELVLNTLAADAAHPAFAKLFVQTAHDEATGALLAWRRLRSPDDAPLFVAQRLLGAAVVEHETDRARFLGRGRTLAAPAAIAGTEPLPGTTGNVLDPTFVLRATLELAPGGGAELALVTAAGPADAEVRATLGRIGTVAAAESALRQTPRVATPVLLGIPPAWLRVVDLERPLRAARATPVRAFAPQVPGPPPADDEPLRCFNGLGGFSDDGTEYVIRLRERAGSLRLPPLPWVNCIANEEAGCLVSERGTMHTWAANSRENRLTPWYNDPVSDPYGEALWLRDEESGAVWSPLPGPAPAPGGHEVRHGFGYTRFRHASGELLQETTVFVPRALPVRIARVRFTNQSAGPRRISLYACAQLVLGGLRQETRGLIRTESGSEPHLLLARNPERAEFAGRVAFAAGVAAGDVAWQTTTDRAAFLGTAPGGGTAQAVLSGANLDGRTGDVPDACFAQRATFTLAAGEAFECALLLGEAADEAAALACVAQLDSLLAVDHALAEVREWWRTLLGRVQVRTPVPALDLMVNGWLCYQNLVCRMWARTAFYQSGGAYGFRDQLQDSSALLWLDPGITRRQIVLHAGHQFPEGDVLHWWHPPLSKGIRTRFADDLLWLPYVTAHYIRATDDEAVLDEPAPFRTARTLEPGEDEAFLVPDTEGSATIYEHCCLAVDRSLTAGTHGLPLMGTGDWNDGMNRVGREGRGESVWLGFFLFDTLRSFLPLCERRGDTPRVQRYREYLLALAAALNDGGWDGEWYRRAYYDSGVPLGAATNDECRIDTIAQAWAVLSGAAPGERAEQALDAMERHLVSEQEGIIRLLAPAFDRTPHDPGYIKGYLPGVRENGGQYTHGALWGVRALAEAGRCERAAGLLEMLSPVARTASPEAVAVYRAEPYVIAADVYGVAPHVGRAGWTWYTGSAGWMYRVALESVLGLERRADVLLLRPCIPAAWPGFTVQLQHESGTCTIDVIRHEAPTRAILAGEPLAVGEDGVRVPLRPGATHVDVALGSDSARRYTEEPLLRITSA